MMAKIWQDYNLANLLSNRGRTIVPELYIGNISKQVYQFAYRSPERPGVIVQTIPIGGQIRVSPNGTHIDLSTPEIDSILDQHRTYGMVSIDEVNVSQSPFSGLCYSIGKQISVDKLRRAMLKKEEALKNYGQQLRREAALAVNSQIEEQIGAPLRQLEMSFQEEEPRSGYADELDHVAEGVRVTRQSDTIASIEQGRKRR
jgi:hypothetical protein